MMNFVTGASMDLRRTVENDIAHYVERNVDQNRKRAFRECLSNLKPLMVWTGDGRPPGTHVANP